MLVASVAVDLTALDPVARGEFDADGLHGALLLRLTEEGYAIRPPDAPASFRIALRAAHRQLAVLVNDREPGPRVALSSSLPLFHLEAVHRTLVALRAASSQDADAAELAPAFIQLVARGDAAEASWLHGQLAVTAVAAGFELVGSPDAAKLLVCVTADDATASIALATRADGCRDRAAEVAVQRTAGASVHAFMTAVVAEARPLLAAAARVAAAPGPLAARASNDRQTGASRRRWELAAAGGALVRGSAVDPVVALAASFGRRDGWRATGWLTAATASANQLSVFEAATAVGVGWQLGDATAALQLQISLVAGVRVHRYQLLGEAAAQRFDWIAAIPIGVSRPIIGSWRADATALLARAETARTHLADTGDQLWHRSAWQLGVLLGIGYRFQATDAAR